MKLDICYQNMLNEKRPDADRVYKLCHAHRDRGQTV